jgi:DedD protein
MIELRFSDRSSPSPASWKRENPNLIEDFIFYRMSLFSFLRKNKQESASDDSVFRSRAEGESKATRSRGKRKKGDSGEEAVDPVLPEKKRARRRLIGAIALVLAAIIGLPMVLDSEPKPLADDIAIQIPSKDKTPARPARSTPPAASGVPASATLDPKEEVIDPPPLASTTTKSTPPAAAVAPPAPVEQTTDKPKDVVKAPEPAKVAAAEKPAAPPAPKIDDKPQPKAAEKSDDAARAKALLEGKSDPKAVADKTDKKPGKFVVQVAALATKEKVDELQTKLKDAGIKSYTQKVATASGDRTRIRVGPFANKDEADKMRARIVKLGLNGTLVPT